MFELGNSRAVVTKIYPLVLKMKCCIDSYGFLTRDGSYPYVHIFDGQKRYVDQLVLHEKLDTLDELYSRKSEYLLPDKLSKDKKNPEIHIEFFEGELAGKKLSFTKNLMYQMKQEELYGAIPEVKTSYTIGKSMNADYNFPNSTLRQIQCKIEFDPMWGWQMSDPFQTRPIYGNGTELSTPVVSPTSVYLASKPQMDKGQASHHIQLFNGMRLAFGDYELTLSIQNRDDRFLPTDLFEDDRERFFEETEDEVRKQMTDGAVTG